MNDTSGTSPHVCHVWLPGSYRVLHLRTMTPYMSMLKCMSSRTRTTVSLPTDLVAHARAASGGNLSAYVEHALRVQQLHDAAPAVRAWREKAAQDTEELADIFGEDVA